ncbi:TetR/AcrR family transcriptional regulator [Galbitalea soli]|uniref:TetR/AcrR family transcriptional regulator n=1 Tax=Galbitalea soli TaxID=1268042 RepID=A0A7C9TTK5_9MICO|nr:TetR/AcrR family transcriptional regulator [Galbitalea soli]NEM92302.1 TetR/AcrR family transcriptional regulator [Galbitalea soli]
MPVGRRERNKEEKRERILAAASELFAVRGVDDVTTQQIADAADIGTGTLFLYAKSKGELLLMVQNKHYEDALTEGSAAAAQEVDVLDAIDAIIRPIVLCNREHIGNGRTYLREVAFGDASEPNHTRSLEIVVASEQLLAHTIERTSALDSARSASLARAVSSLLFRSLAAPEQISGTSTEIVASIRRDVANLLGRPADD